MNHRFLICLPFLLTFFFIHGQQVAFRHYTPKDGLPSAQAIIQIQDSRGYLWISSKNGISQFDGYSFKNFGVSEGLAYYNSYSINEDNSHTIYVLHKKSLYRFDGKRFIAYYTAHSLNAMVPWNEKGMVIHATVNEHPHRNVLLCFRDGLFHPLKLDYPFLDTMDIIDIEKPPKDLPMLLLTRNALYTWNSYETDLLKNFHGTDLLNEGNRIILFGHNNTGAEITWANGRYYLSEIDFLSGETSAKLPFDFSEISHSKSFFSDNEENTWLSSETGIFRFVSDASEAYESHDGVPAQPWSVLEDHRGHIWLGSFFGQLKEFTGQRWIDHTASLKLKIPVLGIGRCRLTSGELWFSHWHGIIRYNGKEFKPLDWAPRTQIECIYEDPVNNQVFVAGTEELLIQRNGNILRYPQFHAEGDSGFVTDVAKTQNDQYWIVTDKRVFLLKDSVFVSMDTPLGKGLTVASDSTGTGWFGGLEGLFYCKGKDQAFISALPEEMQQPVFAIRNFNSTTLLVGRLTDMVLIDAKAFQSGKQEYYTILGPSEGYEGGKCLQNGMLCDRNGKMWILGNERLVVMDPGKLRISKVPPKLHILSAESLNDSLSWDRVYENNLYDTVLQDLLYLRHTQKNLKVRFTGISFSNPEKVVYSWRLLGRGKQWSIPSASREAILPALKPGKYIFQVRAANSGGIWTEEPQQLTIIIRPAFWQSRIFLFAVILCIVIASGTVVILFEKRKWRIEEERNKFLQEYYELQLGNIMKQFDPHFIINMVSCASYLIEMERKDLAQEYLFRFAEVLRKLLYEKPELGKLLGEELAFLETYLELQKIKMGDQLVYSITVEDQELLVYKVPRMVIQNFVENALKHGLVPKNQPGLLKITISLSAEMLWIEVWDNGIGRTAAKKISDRKNGGKGISLTSSLFEMMNSRNTREAGLKIEDRYNSQGDPEGTTVKIYIPKDYRF